MTEKDEAAEGEIIACEVCLKEIPVSEARVEEAEDYISYFCGLECYDKWKAQEKKTEA